MSGACQMPMKRRWITTLLDRSYYTRARKELRKPDFAPWLMQIWQRSKLKKNMSQYNTIRYANMTGEVERKTKTKTKHPQNRSRSRDVAVVRDGPVNDFLISWRRELRPDCSTERRMGLDCTRRRHMCGIRAASPPSPATISLSLSDALV